MSDEHRALSERIGSADEYISPGTGLMPGAMSYEQ